MRLLPNCQIANFNFQKDFCPKDTSVSACLKSVSLIKIKLLCTWRATKTGCQHIVGFHCAGGNKTVLNLYLYIFSTNLGLRCAVNSLRDQLDDMKRKNQNSHISNEKNIHLQKQVSHL